MQIERYEKLKKWFEKNKDKFFYGGCFVLVFLVGYGAGNFQKGSRRQSLRTNYTTNSQQTPANKANAPQATTTDPQVQKQAPDASLCLIKGNISSAGRKIYHIPGGASYKTVKPEQCFKTESEAQVAGFVKAGR